MGRGSAGIVKLCGGAVAGDGTVIVSVSADVDGEMKKIQPRSLNRARLKWLQLI